MNPGPPAPGPRGRWDVPWRELLDPLARITGILFLLFLTHALVYEYGYHKGWARWKDFFPPDVAAPGTFCVRTDHAWECELNYRATLGRP